MTHQLDSPDVVRCCVRKEAGPGCGPREGNVLVRSPWVAAGQKPKTAVTSIAKGLKVKFTSAGPEFYLADKSTQNSHVFLNRKREGPRTMM